MEQQLWVSCSSPLACSHEVRFFGQSTSNCWKLILCAALQPEQAACCSAQQERQSLCSALVSTSRCLDRRLKMISSLLLASPWHGACSFPNHSLSFPLWVSAVPQRCELPRALPGGHALCIVAPRNVWMHIYSRIRVEFLIPVALK